MARVLAFNGSPKTDKGNTSLVLTPFLEGMKRAGADVELFYTKKLRINPCQGDANCWFRHPGECFQDDDMGGLLTKFREADFVVFASPVYCAGITGPLKNLIDRAALPIMGTSYELRGNHVHLRLPDGHKSKRIVLVSTCGYWELDNFDPLVVHMRALSGDMGAEFAGALLRPHATLLRGMVERSAPIDDVFESAGEAGYQLVRSGRMPEELLQTVSRELLPRDQYVALANRAFRQQKLKKTAR